MALGTQEFQGVISSVSAPNNVVEMPCRGVTAIGVGLSGIWSASVQFEAGIQDDAGNITWDNFPILYQSSGIWSDSPIAGTNGNYICLIGANSHFRVRCTAFTSGSCQVKIYGTDAPYPFVQNSVGTVGGGTVTANQTDAINIANPFAQALAAHIYVSAVTGVVVRPTIRLRRTVSGTNRKTLSSNGIAGNIAAGDIYSILWQAGASGGLWDAVHPFSVGRNPRIEIDWAAAGNSVTWILVAELRL